MTVYHASLKYIEEKTHSININVLGYFIYFKKKISQILQQQKRNF